MTYETQQISGCMEIIYIDMKDGWDDDPQTVNIKKHKTGNIYFHLHIIALIIDVVRTNVSRAYLLQFNQICTKLRYVNVL